MRYPRRSLLVALAIPLLLSACSDSSKDTATPATSSSGAASSGPASAASTTTCAPVAGDELIALADDKQLQNSDNIVPVARTAVVTPALTTALGNVSQALSQEALNGLNKSTDVDRVQPKQAADDFVKAQGLDQGLSGGSGPIKVVAANFSENQTLANVFADVLTAAGFSASVVQLNNREGYLAALDKGEVDVVPEYAATLTEALNPDKATPKATGDINATVAALSELAGAKGLTVLTPAEATDQNAFAVTKAFADKYSVTSLSELASKCGGGLTLGGPPECPQRPFCQAGLQSKYMLKFSGFTALDAGGPLSKNALKTGRVAMALVFSSDAGLTAA